VIINLDVLKTALREVDANAYSGETVLSTEIFIQEENIQDNRLGDILTVKMTINKIDKYHGDRESTIVKILEFPATTEAQGKKYRIITQTIEDYDLEKKKN
jgi:hypothetical protein